MMGLNKLKDICRKIFIFFINCAIGALSWGIFLTTVFLTVSTVCFFIMYLRWEKYLSGLPDFILFIAVVFGSIGFGFFLMVKFCNCTDQIIKDVKKEI